MTTNNERVADTSKTIDHIADINKKVSLTELWEKGELKEGEYWCKITESPYVERVYLPCCEDIIIEVLAPVPSYEEYNVMNYRSSRFSVRHFETENKSLKELLKECRDVIEWYKADCGYKDVPTESILTKIDEALK